MSLKDRVKQIALNSVKGYVSTFSQITQNNVTAGNTGQVQAGIIQSFSSSANQFSVLMSDNTVQLVNPAGLRQVGPGDAVLVAGGAIVG